jgi:polysaccharide biosynthesis/export protein
MPKYFVKAVAAAVFFASSACAFAQGAPQALRPYSINPGDEIEIYVWGEERLQRVIRVLPDGTFSFPLVGKVTAVGQLPSQIEALITKGLEGQYRGQVPQVTVSVRNPSGLQFSVAGRVKNPGTFSPGRYVNLLEAISFAGGPDEFAGLDSVSIIRKSGNGLVTIKARIAAAFKGGAAARDINTNAIPQIESGDTVIVP